MKVVGNEDERASKKRPTHAKAPIRFLAVLFTFRIRLK